MGQKAASITTMVGGILAIPVGLYQILGGLSAFEGGGFGAEIYGMFFLMLGLWIIVLSSVSIWASRKMYDTASNVGGLVALIAGVLTPLNPVVIIGAIISLASKNST